MKTSWNIFWGCISMYCFLTARDTIIKMGRQGEDSARVNAGLCALENKSNLEEGLNEINLSLLEEGAGRKKVEKLLHHSRNAGTPEQSVDAYLRARHYYNELMKIQ